MSLKLTTKQRKVFNYLVDYIKNTKNSPTLDEIQDFLGAKSVNSVIQYLDSLEKKSLIIRHKGVKRNIEIVDKNKLENIGGCEIITIPVFASVGCDNLNVIATENTDEFLDIDKRIINSKNRFFAVRAVGFSMKDAGVSDGDLVLIEETQDVNSGDKVVVVVGDVVTMKRIEKKDGFIVLYPESKDPVYKPIVLKDDFKIIGKVVCVIPDESFDYTEVVPINENF
jgi:repressor LexA